MRKRAIHVAILFYLLSLPLAGETTRLRLATTTSTENSGLTDVLLSAFREDTGIHVDVIAVGTGKALRLGELGEVDCILVHAPEAEQAFVAQGFGVMRKEIMHNDFVLLGPPNDPAGLQTATTTLQAFIKIRDHGLANNTAIRFISRGDDSGTHKKELSVWRDAGIRPEGRWYWEIGQGMGATIIMADQIEAYTISDRGTFLSLGDRIILKVLFEGVRDLHNQYGIIAVNPDLHAEVNYQASKKLIEWIVSERGQQIICEFKIGNERLFAPDVYPELCDK